MKKIFIILCLMSLIVAGCKNKNEDPGVIAKVNGAPIYLEQLDYKYDLIHESGTSFVPTIDQVKADYGEILSEIIVEELVLQELNSLNNPVTDADVQKEETEIRKDYPEGAFEQTLTEEYIDLEQWRIQLKYQLAMDKFYREVIRPEIKINYQEAEDYYKSNISKFYLPAGYRFILVRGQSKELVKKALDFIDKGASLEEISAKLKHVTASEVWIRDGRLPVEWKGPTKGIKEGEKSAIFSQGRNVLCVILKEKKDATLQTPLQAYPKIERILVEKQMSEKFKAWLNKKMAESNIEISQELMSKKADSKKEATTKQKS